MLKNILKFSGGAVLVVVVGLGAIMAIDYVRYRSSQDYRDQKEVEQVKKEIAQDPYGGDTPEETLRLFIEALKKGDTELAAKYFVYEKQEAWREDLAKIEEKGLLEGMIKDLGTAKIGTSNSVSRAVYSLANEKNESAGVLVIIKVQSGRWKIQDL